MSQYMLSVHHDLVVTPGWPRTVAVTVSPPVLSAVDRARRGCLR